MEIGEHQSVDHASANGGTGKTTLVNGWNIVQSDLLYLIFLYVLTIFFYVVADNGAKSLRQIHDEKEDEERFQEDLKKAVLQSLGMILFKGLSAVVVFMYKMIFCIGFGESLVLISYSNTTYRVGFSKWDK